MFENVLHDLGGVGLYGVISICLFFAVFVGVVIWALCLKKRYVKEMGHLPLEDDSAVAPDADSTPRPEQSHE